MHNEDAFLAAGCVYIGLFLVSGIQFIRNCHSYPAWTKQKIVHLLLSILTIIRAGFLIAIGAFDWCHIAVTGELSEKCEKNQLERQLFYAVDQLPSLMFFTVYFLLGIFWAEVYYNATDQIQFFNEFVKPISKAIVVVVYVLQISLWALYADPWRDEGGSKLNKSFLYLFLKYPLFIR